MPNLNPTVDENPVRNFQSKLNRGNLLTLVSNPLMTHVLV